MKCPHCERTWNDQEFLGTGLSPTVVLSDHVQRFCPGNPPEVRHVRRRTLLQAEA